ncbi:hypothetical protein BLN97_01730 [Bradyrhizobium elkanii]|nr:hypothetical protein A6452_07800 [Bradyrhizobium elkanii]ODM75242.1 hypothetical protein A6X20_33295 [Bradyrhizobium elkanii]OIM96064.1 hypothetical protein BLN97_01730 [Bradyrhizobium elkanii]
MVTYTVPLVAAIRRHIRGANDHLDIAAQFLEMRAQMLCVNFHSSLYIGKSTQAKHDHPQYQMIRTHCTLPSN